MCYPFAGEPHGKTGGLSHHIRVRRIDRNAYSKVLADMHGYDVIVVGSGSAGAVVAARLSEDPSRSVLLIEAGPDYPDPSLLPPDVKQGHATGADNVIGGRHDWQFTARATSSNTNMPVPRGYVTGGTSAVNGQVFLRGVPEDYDLWAAWGNTGWSWRDVLPYFRRLETDLDYPGGDFHGSDGPILVRRYKPHELMADQSAFTTACRDLGFPLSPDHNDPGSAGVGPLPLNNPDGIRWSTALGYLAPARQRLNLTIKANCLVRRVVFDGRRAVGVEVESPYERWPAGGGEARRGEAFIAYGDEIVLSAGPIGSPQLLMLSGIGPAPQLKQHGIPIIQESPGVGRNLRDHPTLHVVFKADPAFPMPAAKVGPQKVALRYTASGSKLRNDMMSVMRWRSEEREFLISAAVELALSEGEVRLRTLDPHDQPDLDYNLLDDPEDRRRLREGVRLNVRIGRHDSFRGILGELTDPTPVELESDTALDAWMLKKVQTMQHISCTCKMGPDSDALAVVDHQLRVKGVRGLRVADCSVMPDCPRANTNATAIMIGERLADLMSHRA